MMLVSVRRDMSEIESLVRRAGKAEKEVEQLCREFESLQKTLPPEGEAVPAELEKLRVDNTKLKYRLGILRRAAEKEESSPSSSSSGKIKEVAKKQKKKTAEQQPGRMKSILHLLVDEFRAALEEAFPDIPDAPCPVTLSVKQGDYQFNGAMGIAGILKVRSPVLCTRMRWK